MVLSEITSPKQALQRNLPIRAAIFQLYLY